MKPARHLSFYIFIVLLFIAMLAVTLRYFNGSGRSTVGMTYAKEYKINAEKSALVTGVHVVSGQQVKTGDLLVELSSHNLEMEMDKLQNRILALMTEQAEKAKLLGSEIAYTKAQHNIQLEDISSDITEIESELKLNRQLTKDFSAGSETDDHSQDPMQLKVTSLDQQRKMHQQALGIKIADIEQKNKTDQTLLNNQIKLLQRELELLVDEKKKLNKYATFNGVIENVYVKAGEEVDAFSALLSANPQHPTTVIGYFTGKRDREIPIGSPVTILSYDRHQITVSGKVIGFGSVVELPTILQKSTAVKAFGRQIFIEIDADNGFSAGEKVLIK